MGKIGTKWWLLIGLNPSRYLALRCVDYDARKDLYFFESIKHSNVVIWRTSEEFLGNSEFKPFEVI